MKQFITLKVGYTVGIYGCSGEYFNTIIIDKDKISQITYRGMYGADERINRALNEKGYKQVYLNTDYGKMTKKDISPIFVSENEALETINNLK